MAENIDNLLVGLGLDVDSQSFQRGESSLMALRNAGLTAGAAIAAVAGGANVVSELSETRSAAGFMAESLGLAADEADRLGFALEQMGGDSESALSVLRQMRDLRDQFLRGEGALFTAGEFGIQAGPIANAASEMEALIELSSQLQGLSSQQRNLAIGDLGFENTGIANLLRGGPGQFREQLGRAEELRQLTQEEIDTSQELIRAQNELGRAVSELNDSIVLKLAPALTDIFNRWTDFISGDDEESSGFDQEAYRRSLTDNAGLPPEAFNQSNETDNGPGLSQRLRMWADERYRRTAGEPMTRPAPSSSPTISDQAINGIQQMLETMQGPMPQPALQQPSLPQTGAPAPRELNMQTLEAIRQRQQEGNFTPQDREYLREQMRQQFPNPPQASSGMSATFNIYDARDPEMVAKVVRREVRDLSERGANSYRSRVT